jgi:membrane-bound lytic murein transglycosylase D
MNTMLKRRLEQSGVLTSGFLLLAVPTISYFAQESAFAQAPVPGRDAYYVAAVSTSATGPSFNYGGLLMDPEAPRIGLQPQAQLFVKKYLAKSKDDLLAIHKKSNYHFETIEKIFSKQNLPLELKYLAMVESNLKTTALSRVGAAGLWQLMPETARCYGLKVTRKSDERKNAYKSTVAAGKYLKDLYGEFGDWLLVIAAYNSGSGTVYNAIKKSGSRNYWAVRRFLPAETKGHVEHFISVHYLFEGSGSSVTLTKYELQKHKQSVSDYLSKKACESEVETTTF